MGRHIFQFTALVFFTIILSCSHPTGPATAQATLYTSWYAYQHPDRPWEQLTPENTDIILSITPDTLYTYGQWNDTVFDCSDTFTIHYVRQTTEPGIYERTYKLTDEGMIRIVNRNYSYDTTHFRLFNGTIPPWPEKTHLPCE